jgi:hypothetical protein
MTEFSIWLASAPLPLLGILILALAGLAAFGGYALRQLHKRRTPNTEQWSETQESYIVSAVLGLLALLLGFTYSLAIDRYETRRELVLQEANAVGTAYLRAQLLEEPHRARISKLLQDYAGNRIALARVQQGKGSALLAANDRLVTDLWAAQAAAFDSIKTLDFSNASIEAMNTLIDLDSARKAARYAHVPSEVFAILLIYMTATGAVMGYTLSGLRGRTSAAFLMALFTMSFLLVIDVDSPTAGGIREIQAPMEQAHAAMMSQPPGVFDRWRAH